MRDIDRLRLVVQAIIAIGVLSGATLLAYEKIIDSGAVIALYSFAAGAVTTGTVGRLGATTTQHYSNGGTLTTERKEQE